ncbi:MurR/RpiR family transcriptional regulator [Eubacteriales bacterium OttesenSCG-928-M02]|nr:MurR/RpiR family transcriptional regulator [Eubacteriales bacterium OttesenSCG-928-M02]
MSLERDVMQRIANARHRMSKGQKRIADFIVNNYDSAAFMTASALGDAVQVSESTVVRFAMALEYDGYPGLQKSLQEIIRNRLTNVQRINLTSDLTEEAALANVLKSDMANLRNTIENLDAQVFRSAIQCILNAKDIYIMGLRSAQMLAQFLSYYLNFVLPNVKLVGAGVLDAIDQIMRIGEGDVLIAITFPRYSTRTVEAVQVAKAKGAQVIAITDGDMSPITPPADYALVARSDMTSFVDSLVAPLSLINAIIVACGMNRKEEVAAYFEELERMWEDFNVYSGERLFKADGGREAGEKKL